MGTGTTKKPGGKIGQTFREIGREGTKRVLSMSEPLIKGSFQQLLDMLNRGGGDIDTPETRRALESFNVESSRGTQDLEKRLAATGQSRTPFGGAAMARNQISQGLGRSAVQQDVQSRTFARLIQGITTAITAPGVASQPFLNAGLGGAGLQSQFASGQAVGKGALKNHKGGGGGASVSLPSGSSGGSNPAFAASGGTHYSGNAYGPGTGPSVPY